MFCKKSILLKYNYPSFYLFAFTFILGIVTANLNFSLTVPLFALFSLVIVLYLVGAFGKITNQKTMYIIFILGLILRVAYVLYTDATVRQHDVEQFGSGIGHAGYIEYFYNNFISLPKFDVREIWQFYHPPLHHIISALYMHILTAFGIGYSSACESLQTLSLLYSALSMLICYKLFVKIGLKNVGLLLAMLIIAFHPTFIVFSGSINNDPLSVLFMLAAIYYTVIWYNSQKLTDIIKIALCIGLGMFTKLSAWMVAPAIAFVFLYKFVKSRGDITKKLILQFLVFALICVPLGLFWSIRNYILFDVPFTYIPLLSTDNPQYVGDISAIKRLLDFSPYQFASVYDMWGDPYYEYNPTIALLKTAMFGEWINSGTYPAILVVGVVLFWSGAVTGALSVVATVLGLINKKIKNPLFIFLLILTLTIVFMYYWFCLQYPFTCTQNIRYAVPLIPLSAIAIGWLNNNIKLNKYLQVLVLLFCIFSVATYFVIGI